MTRSFHLGSYSFHIPFTQEEYKSCGGEATRTVQKAPGVSSVEAEVSMETGVVSLNSY